MNRYIPLLFIASLTLTPSCRTLCGELSQHLEPNNSFEQAIPLTTSEAIETSVDQADSDFFVIEASSSEEILIQIDSQTEGYNVGGTFEIYGPGEVKIEPKRCGAAATECPPELGGASLQEVEDSQSYVIGYRVVLKVEDEGSYYLRVFSGGKDHLCGFPWDYRIQSSLR